MSETPFEPPRQDEMMTLPLSTQGANNFIEAAAAYPASNTAQAARLAQLSLESGIDPSKLSVALLTDGVQVRRIVRRANVEHQIADADVDTIDQTEARRVILDNYRLADQLIALGSDKLENILELYPQYRQGEDEEDDGGSRESTYRKLALGMLKVK